MYRCTACSFLNGGNPAASPSFKTPSRNFSLAVPGNSLLSPVPSSLARRTPSRQGDAKEDEEAVMSRIHVGDFVEAFPNARKGRVEFIGEVPETGERGLWIGVTFFKPEGKNDGEVNGKRYFQTQPLHGGFIRPNSITVIPAMVTPGKATAGAIPLPVEPQN